MKLRTYLAALCGALLLFPAPASAQDAGYHRTYVIQADGAWLGPGRVLKPAFVQISDGRIDWISEEDQRKESKNMFGKSMGKAKLIRVSGTLAPGLVDAWTTLAPADFRADRKPGPLRKVEDSLPVQAVREDMQLYSQILAARQAGVAAVYLSAGRSGLRQGVGTAAEFTSLDLPLQSGFQALDFAVGAVAASGLERVYQMEDLRNAFEEARSWRESWDDFDESMEKYDKSLEKYQEKLDQYIEDKAAQDKKEAEDGVAAAGDTDADAKKELKMPQRPKRPKEPQSSAARNLLLDAMDGALPVRVVADRVVDIRALIQLKQEFQLNLILVGGRDADFVAEELAEAEIPVILSVVLDHHAKPDPARSFAHRYLRLRAAKVEVAIASGGAEGAELLLPLRAGEIIAAGGAEAEVWASLTTVPAKLLGLSDYGTLDAGHSATMILFEGRSPFDASAPFKAHKPK